MKNQDKIIVIGHKNPDTDSICSAIAYADIKNRTDLNNKYAARRAGQINEETKFVLDYFEQDPPAYLGNVGTQVKDMEIHICPQADKTMSLKTAWELMKKEQIVTLPITDAEGQLEGIITVGDIAQSYMDTTDSLLLSNARTQYRRIAETLDGLIIEGNEHAYFVEGKVVVGIADPDLMREYVHENDLVILGNREEDALYSIEQNVSCIIVGMGIEVSEHVKELARQRSIVIIMSPYDTFTISRLINQSIPISYVMRSNNIVSFSTEDFTDDIQAIMAKKRHRDFPVINKRGKCVGTISRRNFLDMKHKKVILVDHNEKGQAVDNVEAAEVLEIVDHHKLGSLETMAPITFRNEPVGCTGTILYKIYEEHRLEIPPTIAGLLCSAILSDTLMFRSPTCTQQDKIAASALSLIAGINMEDFAKKMFRAGSNLSGKSPDEIFFQDYKKFLGEGNQAFGVGQISSMDYSELAEIKPSLLAYMKEQLAQSDVSRIFFMLTDIIEESTHLLYMGEGADQMVDIAFHAKPEDDEFLLKGVVSRKKQLIPAFMEACQMMASDF